MIYRRISPQPALCAFVKEYLLLHFEYDKSKPQLVKAFPPLPEHGLEFFPRGQVTSINQHTGEVKVAPRNVIFGQQVSRINFVMPAEDYVMVRVIFHSGALFRLFRMPLREFTDQKSDAAMVISSEIEDVNERLSNATQYPQLIQLVEQYLLKKVRGVKIDIHPVDKIGDQILNNPTSFSLDWLADQACVSPRQFERKFVERMGIGPKLFSSISRFHKAFSWKERNPNADWLTVAIKFGYTDFHHLFKDFKRFATVTPNTLISQCAHSPEKILRLA